MQTYTNAKEVILKNEQVVLVFTRDDKFHYDSLGNGTTGNWKVDREELDEVEKVIIYLRRPGENINRIFLGDYAGWRNSEEQDRYIIRFTHLKEVGTTQSTWMEFAGFGQNPIGFVC
jgi:hypothetical protein